MKEFCGKFHLASEAKRLMEFSQTKRLSFLIIGASFLKRMYERSFIDMSHTEQALLDLLDKQMVSLDYFV